MRRGYRARGAVGFRGGYGSRSFREYPLEGEAQDGYGGGRQMGGGHREEKENKSKGGKEEEVLGRGVSSRFQNHSGRERDWQRPGVGDWRGALIQGGSRDFMRGCGGRAQMAGKVTWISSTEGRWQGEDGNEI